MSALGMESMQWSTLKHITDVKPIGEDDAACLEEIRAVLEKHSCLERFGVTLLHSHFDLEDDEMMLETTDLEKREHWVRPVKQSSLEEDGRTVQPTVITFNENGYNQACGCDARSTGHPHKSLGLANWPRSPTSQKTSPPTALMSGRWHWVSALIHTSRDRVERNSETMLT